MDSWTLKSHISFQNKSNRKAANSFASRRLQLQQKVLKFKDTCVSWRSPKTDLEDIKNQSENQKFKYVTFSQLQFLSKYLTFLYLINFTCFFN